MNSIGSIYAVPSDKQANQNLFTSQVFGSSSTAYGKNLYAKQDFEGTTTEA